VTKVAGPASQHRVELVEQAAERPVQRSLSQRPDRALDVRQSGLAGVGVNQTLARASLLVPLDAEAEKVEALVNVSDPRLGLREPQPNGTQHPCHLVAQGYGVVALAGHQNHEVVRVADEAGGRQTVAPSPLPRAGGVAKSRPCLGEVLVERTERNVGQQW